MTHPCKKHDFALERDLTNAERLEPARSTLRFAVQLLEQFSKVTEFASPLLTETQLETICKAVDQAYLAAENCAFMGHSSFNAHALDRVEWTND